MDAFDNARIHLQNASSASSSLPHELSNMSIAHTSSPISHNVSRPFDYRTTYAPAAAPSAVSDVAGDARTHRPSSKSHSISSVDSLASVSSDAPSTPTHDVDDVCFDMAPIPKPVRNSSDAYHEQIGKHPPSESLHSTAAPVPTPATTKTIAHAAAAAAPAVAPSESMLRNEKHKNAISFRVGNKYKVCEIIGEGAYGVVCSAIHRATGQKVAIKKIQPFEHQMFALRTLRELKLLRFFQECDVSENIISILDIIKPSTYEAFTEVYLVQELMETDLHRVIRTQELSDDHCQYFTYQTLRALKPMHCADVIHRDLKPSNVLLNANCDLKVCDFGLARSVLTADQDTGFMTEYVATRWYRAPEIMLTFKQYTKAIDVWAVGCILAEMLTGRPLFPGRDYHQQLSLILDVLGTPTLEEFQNINSRRSRDYIRTMPLRKRRDFRTLFPKASPEAIDFLQKTLTFDPRNRLTVEECLQHPYLSAYHDPDDEPGAPRLDPDFFYFDMQKESITKEDLRKELWYQVQEFQPLLR